MGEEVCDVIIIGGGPGGLTAAIYTARGGLDTIVLEKAVCGGLAATTDLLENYPGFPEGINGMDLMDKFKSQAQKFGANISEFKEVKKIEKAGHFVSVKTDKDEYKAYSVIIGSGSVPKKLNVPGEEKFTGKGVSYCATCDGPLYKGKDVVVVGAGNSGLQESEYLLKHVKSVTIVEFLPHVTGEKILEEQLQKNTNVKFLLNHLLASINGKDVVESVTVKNRGTEEERTFETSGVFIYAGFLPYSELAKGVVEMDEQGYIITNENMETSTPGIYAAGDIRSKRYRQVAIACGEGTIAGMAATEYVNKLRISDY